MGDVIRAVRDAVGSDFSLMVDLQCAFPDADTCLDTVRSWEGYDVFLLEAPLPVDDLDGYACLSREQGIPIAAGEWLTTRYEFEDLMVRGRGAVVQPDIGRAGRLSECLRILKLASEQGLTVVPRIWKSGISIAAGAPMAAVAPHCPSIEFLPSTLCGSALRQKLVKDELRLHDGSLPLPKKPGLGVDPDRDAMEEFERPAERFMRRRASRPGVGAIDERVMPTT